MRATRAQAEEARGDAPREVWMDFLKANGASVEALPFFEEWRLAPPQRRIEINQQIKAILLDAPPKERRAEIKQALSQYSKSIGRKVTPRKDNPARLIYGKRLPIKGANSIK